MDLYSSSSDFYSFSGPYNAKRLLHDSVTRTLEGYNSICQRTFVGVLTGCGNILLARIESATAFVFVTISAMVSLIYPGFAFPFILIPVTLLNILSRFPGISSFTVVQDFTRETSSLIVRALRVSFLALPVIFLFLTTAGINTVVPGMLGSENGFFRLLHWMVEPLGPLEHIRAVVPGRTSEVGTKSVTSPVSDAEDYLRALSYRNYLTEETVSLLIYHYSH